MAKLIQIVRPLIEGWEQGDFRGSRWDVVSDDLVVTGLTGDGRVSELHWHSRREGALTAAGLDVT